MNLKILNNIKEAFFLFVYLIALVFLYKFFIIELTIWNSLLISIITFTVLLRISFSSSIEERDEIYLMGYFYSNFEKVYYNQVLLINIRILTFILFFMIFLYTNEMSDIREIIAFVLVFQTIYSLLLLSSHNTVIVFFLFIPLIFLLLSIQLTYLFIIFLIANIYSYIIFPLCFIYTYQHNL